MTRAATDSTSAPDEDDYYPFRVTSWPASDPLVTAVGGTQLHLDAWGNHTAPDNVWNDTALLGSPAAGGGGISTVFPRPFYQNGVARTTGGGRGVPDVSMSGAVDGGAEVYLGFTSTYEAVTPGWYTIGGTSESTPEFAGIVAIADQAAHRDLGWLNPELYGRGASGLTDITSGNNSVSFTNPSTDPYPGAHTVTGFNAAPGLRPGQRSGHAQRRADDRVPSPAAAGAAGSTLTRTGAGLADRRVRRSSAVQTAAVSVPSSREIATSIE